MGASAVACERVRMSAPRVLVRVGCCCAAGCVTLLPQNAALDDLERGVDAAHTAVTKNTKKAKRLIRAG